LTLNLSCNTNVHDDVFSDLSAKSTIKKVLLEDSLGTLLIAVPNRYDTFFCFGYNEGCGQGISKLMYKFQATKVGLFEESGMINHSEPKRKDQILISHIRTYRPHTVSEISYINDYHSLYKREAQLSYLKVALEKDYVRQSNVGLQSIFVFRYEDTTKDYIMREVVTFFLRKNNEVKVKYLYVADRKDTIADSFIDEALHSANSLKISNGY
jgi:hypothetical protein